MYSYNIVLSHQSVNMVPSLLNELTIQWP